MNILLFVLYTFITFILPLHSSSSASTSLAEEEKAVSSLQQISRLGKTIFEGHAPLLSSLARHGTASPLIMEIGKRATQDLPLPTLQSWEKIYDEKFPGGIAIHTLMLEASPAGESEEERRASLSPKESSFVKLGFAIAYLSYEQPLENLIPLLSTGLKRIFDYYRGEKPLIFSLQKDGSPLFPPLIEEEALPPTPERLQIIKKAAQLHYNFLLRSPLTQPLPFWDVAKAAGWFAYLEYGADYAQQEGPLFHRPMEERFKTLIADHPRLKFHVNSTTLPFQEQASDGPSVEEKYQKFFMEELSKYINASLVGSYFLKGREERSLEGGIKMAQITKKRAYKTMADLVVALYPERSEADRLRVLQSLQEKEWGLCQMKTLFQENGTPNWENELWGELVFGYEKIRRLRAPVGDEEG